MFVAILFCLLMCPHDSFGAEQECRVCEAGFECQDLCDCHSPQHQCALDSLHSHEFRDDTSSTSIQFNFDLSLVHVALLLDGPKHPFLYSDTIACSSAPSFAVRHLDTIILRV